GAAGEPPPHRAHAGPGGSPLQNAAQIQSASCLGTGADSRPEPAQPGVYSACTRYRLRWGYYLPFYGRRLVVPCRRAVSVLSGGGRVVDGGPYAGRTGQPCLGDGDRSAAAHRGVDHAYRSWQSVWG